MSLDARLSSFREPIERAVARAAPPWLGNERDDLVQDSLVRLHRQLMADPDRPVSRSYLARIAHSAVIDELRRRSRRARIEADSRGDLDEVATGGDAPDERLRDRRAGRALRDCLRAAAPRTQHAITLYLLGHSVPEAGRLLGVGTKSAENLVYRGLAALRACLLRKGVVP